MPNVKLDVADVLWVADQIEPRVLEVLPAALIHFPKTFIRVENLPEELKQIVRAMKKGESSSSNFDGIAYKEMKRWADLQLVDRRTKPLSKKRQSRNYRFMPETLERLKKIAKNLGKTETTVIEELILSQGEL